MAMALESSKDRAKLVRAGVLAPWQLLRASMKTPINRDRKAIMTSSGPVPRRPGFVPDARNDASPQAVSACRKAIVDCYVLMQASFGHVRIIPWVAGARLNEMANIQNMMDTFASHAPHQPCI